jgi:two-component system sensor histidine kinase RegB
MMGVWLSILLAIGFIGVYAWQITEESRQLADALAATELVLTREQHLSQLDGLAAAAAHELGTPLSTISVIAKELENAIPADAPHGEDVRLLRSQATRCRDILAKLTELSASGEPFDRTPLTSLIEEVVAPHRDFGVAIAVSSQRDGTPEPVGARNPAILYGLGNLVENAVDFASERVDVAMQWNEDTVEVTITDDGPGFAPDILSRIGEPYVTTRRRRPDDNDDQPTGLGLGFFIAKTLLERSGATLNFANRSSPQRGAIVTLRWKRADFERPLSFAQT